MGMRTSHLLLLCLVIVLVTVAIICHLIALVTDYWLRSSSGLQQNFLNIGLFSACFDQYSHPHEDPVKFYDGCHGIQSDYYATIQDWLVPSWLISCRAVAVIGLILQIVGVLFLILLLLAVICKCLFCEGRQDCCERFLIYATPITFIIAGMFIMMSVMIFADNAFRLQCKDFWLGGGDPFDNHLAYSWGFEVAATIFTFLTGGFTIWLVVLRARDEL